MKFFALFVFLFASSAWAEKMVVLGDSLTEGYGVSKENAYPALLEKKLKGWTVVNAGISSSTTASAPSRMEWILKLKPDLVLLALGANDGLRGQPVKSAKENLKKAIELAKKNKVKIILLGMEMPPNYGAAYRKEFHQMYQDLSKAEKIPLMPFLLKDVAAKKDLNQIDGIHPNEEGHKIMSQNVYEFIKDYL